MISERSSINIDAPLDDIKTADSVVGKILDNNLWNNEDPLVITVRNTNSLCIVNNLNQMSTVFSKDHSWRERIL
jgi:hypothetical protein